MTDAEQDFDELAADLALDAKESWEDARAEQDAYLQEVAEEEGAELLETKCNIQGNTVPVSARLNGELMDKMGRLEDRIERVENGDAGPKTISETADELSQLLADMIDDPEAQKRGFYKMYHDAGIQPLAVILEKLVDAIQQERERQEGVAEGFRST